MTKRPAPARVQAPALTSCTHPDAEPALTETQESIRRWTHAFSEIHQLRLQNPTSNSIPLYGPGDVDPSAAAIAEIRAKRIAVEAKRIAAEAKFTDEDFLVAPVRRVKRRPVLSLAAIDARHRAQYNFIHRFGCYGGCLS